ncbi:aldo/keto reductase [Acaryochloris sp. IP29b_bin.148]|uniref:aldo/keto reductase n=1 Tax=Acaryochloris sp. IP29b_bin.148 TaxID=2969218 RepID=UPI0026093637|nr:aldo/keto reductase [Acaryochloris sp. IP29b_bin.148]
MLTKQLGPHGPHVSAIGIGTWSWGDRLFWGYGSQYGETEVAAAFQAAVAAGITLFDTAEIYGWGESERLLGRFQADHPSSLCLATKYGPVPWRLTQDTVLRAIRDSLSRLQTDTIDLYQVHWPFSFLMSYETLFKALATAVHQGLIQTVGVSNYSVDQMRKAHQLLAQQGIPLAVNQVRYSLITRQIERQGLTAAARDLKVTLLAYSPLAQGLLTGKYSSGQSPAGARASDRRFKPDGLRKLAPVTNLLQKLAMVHDKTMAQVALNWLIAQEGVIPIPGAKTAQQATENVGALGWSLTTDEVAALSEASRPWL